MNYMQSTSLSPDMESASLSPEMESTSILSNRRRIKTSKSQHSPTSSSSLPELTPDSNVTHSDDDEPQTFDIETSLDDPTTQPKIEELDDDVLHVYDLEEAKPVAVKSNSIPSPSRKRGRPRKNPSAEPKKVSYARSKTGCRTCRLRKKKCDETKPGCTNCKKNNVVCDGYEPMQPWQSGRQRGLTATRLQPVILEAMPRALPPLWNGVETEVDQQFLGHFHVQLVNVLSIRDNYNPFQDIIIPMANENVGLMHCVLYLSGSCLTANVYNAEWLKRQEYHHSKALTLLSESLKQSVSLDVHDRSALPNGDIEIAQSLVLFLQTVCAGEIKGQYQIHLKALKAMLTNAEFRFPNEKLRQFLVEFIIYHDYCLSITSFDNPINEQSRDLMNLKLPEYMIPPQAGTLLGVFDGLFGLISRIRDLRDDIRKLREAKKKPLCQPSIVGEAFSIDTALRNWKCEYTKDNPRWACSLLYRQCTWIYLYRTWHPSRASNKFEVAVDQGLEYLSCIPWESGKDSKESMLSVLLMPLFLLGCAAFEPRQRPQITLWLDRLQEWSNLANIKYARVIVEEIWTMMDAGLESETWDWEIIIKNHGWDFLIT